MKETNSNYLVIDTNVLISGLISWNSKPHFAIKKAVAEYIICASNETFKEFLEVSSRPKFAKYFRTAEKERFIKDLLKYIEFIEITERVTDCQDPKDNKFLEVAISANAKFLITGDKRDLLSMNPYRNVEIISVSEFLENH